MSATFEDGYLPRLYIEEFETYDDLLEFLSNLNWVTT